MLNNFFFEFYQFAMSMSFDLKKKSACKLQVVNYAAYSFWHLSFFILFQLFANT